MIRRIGAVLTKPPAILAGVAAPLALVASQLAPAGHNATLIGFTALTSALAAITGTYVTLRKSNGDLASQLQGDTGKFMDRQTRMIEGLQARLDALQEYVLEDVTWHMVVISLLNQHQIDVPHPPTPPTLRSQQPPNG